MNSRSKIPSASIRGVKNPLSSNYAADRKLSHGSDTGVYLGLRDSRIPSSATSIPRQNASANKTCYFSAQKPGFSMSSSVKKDALHVPKPGFSMSTSAKKSVGGRGLFTTTPKTEKTSKFRPSMACSARRSSIMGDRRRVQDSRPLGDRHFQNQCIAKVVEFLTENGYPHKLAPTFLKTLSSTELQRVFEFLFSFVDPAIKVVPLEQEVPRWLKLLGYPFQVNKSCIQSAASNSSRGQLLGILDWLVDCFNYATRVDGDALLFPTSFDEVNVRLAVLDRCLQSPGEDPDQRNEFLRDLVSKKFGTEKEIEDLAIQQEELERENDMFDEEISEEKRLPSVLETYEQDIKEQEDYIRKMDDHMKANANTLKTLGEACLAKQVELQQLQQEEAQLATQVAEQKYNIDDIQWAKDRQKQVDEAISKERQALEVLQKEIRIVKLECEKHNDGLQQLCSDIHLRMAALENVLTSPSIASHCNVFQTLFAKPEWQQVLQSYKDLGRDACVQLREQLSVLAHELKMTFSKEIGKQRVDVVLQEKQKLHDVEMSLGVLLNKVKIQEDSLENASQDLENTRKQQADELAALNDQYNRNQQLFSEREALLRRSDEELKERIKNLTSSYENKLAKYEEEEEAELDEAKAKMKKAETVIHNVSKDLQENVKLLEASLKPDEEWDQNLQQVRSYFEKKTKKKLQRLGKKR